MHIIIAPDMNLVRRYVDSPEVKQLCRSCVLSAPTVEMSEHILFVEFAGLENPNQQIKQVSHVADLPRPEASLYRIP